MLGYGGIAKEGKIIFTWNGRGVRGKAFSEGTVFQKK